MRIVIPFVAALALALALPLQSVSAPTPAPSTSSLPVIVRTVSRRVCSALHTHIGPAIGMLNQDDAYIAKGVPGFQAYNTANGNDSEAGKGIALLHLENLVGPLADNTIAVQKLLNDPNVFPAQPHDAQDVQLLVMRAKLLQILTAQNASLDIINGFVQTQQMADLQHADEGLIQSIAQPDVKGQRSGAPTADPLTHNNEQAGLAPDPYTIDPATIPGLTLGYNPVSRLLEGLKWTQRQSSKHGSDAAKTIIPISVGCGGNPNARPLPTPSP